MGVRIIIAGGGVSGLALGYVLMKKGGSDVMVLEAAGRPGGKIWSDSVQGYVCESGVNGFLDNKPKTLELASMLGLAPLRSSDLARKRYIYSGGRLNRLPESPVAFMGSGLMGIGGKLRIMMEPFIAKGTNPDETLAAFARRRLGSEAADKLIDPMASGVYAGDPEAMSLRSCFPVIYNLEQTHGSLIRGMIALMRQRKKAVSAGPGGTLTSFRGGMQEMADALAGALGDGFRPNTTVVSLDRTGKGYRVHLKDGTVLDGDVVVLCTPAHQSAGILKGMDSGASSAYAEIPYPPLSIVCTGFKKDKIKADLEAFGLLIPFKEKRKVLGVLYDSSVFENRAPEGSVLIRTMVGGARNPAGAELDDRRLLDTVLGELSVVSGVSAEPDFVKIYRHDKAIPQYNIGHMDKVRKLDEFASKHRGLYLSGNALRGVSVNDCVANAFSLADKIYEEVL